MLKVVKNYFVLPAFYESTSFEDIANSINRCILTDKLDVELIGLKIALKNELLSDVLEDNRFFLIQQQIITELMERVTSTSNILFLDFFFPGIDLLKYYFEKNGIIVKMGALLHGGFFLAEDIQSSMDWFKSTERGYFEIFDVIYSPSKFLMDMCPVDYSTKIKVFPWGLDSFEVLPRHAEEKKIDVIFPHRIAADKGIDDLIEICISLPEIQFYVTVPQADEGFIAYEFRHRLSVLGNLNFVFKESAEAHAQTLASAKLVLSCAKQENFGYSVHKSILSGCIPVLPKGLCYDEFISPDYIYNDVMQAVKLIRKWHYKKPEWSLERIYKTTYSFTFSDLLVDFYG